jgi:hypothetical protein
MEHNPSAGDRPADNILARYLRLVEPVLRGKVVVIIAITVFVLAGAVDGRAGLILASAFVLFHGTYCLLNFWHCRETHCIITGLGWTSLALLGFAAGLTPGEVLPWYQPDVETAAYLVILAIGYTVEWAVATRTGRRSLQ